MGCIDSCLNKVAGESQADAPWYIKHIKALTIFISILTIFFGFWMALHIFVLNLWCALGGILQMIAGLLILSVEAPNLFKAVSVISLFNEKIGKRPYWVRAVFYIVVLIPALILCSSWESISCNVSMFLIAILYIIMSLRGIKPEGTAAATEQTIVA